MKSVFMKNKYFCHLHILRILFLFMGLALARQENPFRVMRIITGHAKMNGEKINVNYTVSKKGDTIYTLTKILDYDLPVPEVAVFNNGQSVMVNSFDGTLSFFDAQGQAGTQIKILKEQGVKYERNIKVAADGERLVLAFNEPGLNKTLLHIYDSEGRIINQWKIDEEFVNGLSYSKKSGLVAVSVFSWRDNQLVKSVLFYNERGEPLSRIAANFTIGSFVDEKQLFSGQTNKNFFLYDLKSLKNVFTYDVSVGEMIITAIYSNQLITLVTTKPPVLDHGKWFYENPSIKQFNNQGELLKSWKENVPSFSTFKFEHHGEQLLFVMDAKTVPIK